MTLECDVLVAGGGPTGVTLAVLLAQLGVKVLVADKAAEVYPLPRAAHLDHESMRILQQAGVAHDVMASSRHVARYDFLNAAGEILLRFEGMDQRGPGGWPLANMIHQPSVEHALRGALARLPQAELHCGWELQSFSEDGNGISARLATPAGERMVRARYLVGADGARSPVREACGITFDDLGFEEPWLVVDVLVDDYTRLPHANLQICDPDRPTTCVLMGEGRHRWEFMIKPGESAEQVSEDAFIARLLAPWKVDGAVRLERKAVYTFRARIANAWRKGRVLLAGDAAHQTPPFAGQGMCSGLRDAANLAWKLAAEVSGVAEHSLLDSYQPEREPNLRATIEMAIMMGRTVCITDTEAAAARDAQMLDARAKGQAADGALAYPPLATGIILAGAKAAGSYFPQAIAADGAMLDEVLGAAPCLLTRKDLMHARMAPFAEQLRAWLDSHDSDAVLLRPDRYVFGAGDGVTLANAWRRSSGIALRTL